MYNQHLGFKMLKYNCQELLKFLERFKPRKFSVVVLPDFFLDRFVSYEGDVAQLSETISQIVARKGGSIDNIYQFEFRGGNAANTAAALATLGATVIPIIHTNLLGLNLLKYYFQHLGVDLNHVKIGEKLSITTAIELTHKTQKVNVMLRDLGSLADFSPNNLTEDDYRLIENADYVCIFNWAGTRKYGTELAQHVFYHAKEKGKGKTYYDTADPTPNKENIPKLVEKLLLTNRVDILSLNENEAIQYASAINPKEAKDIQKQSNTHSEIALECARLLAKNLTARIDLHSTTFSATLSKEGETIVPVFKVSVLRVTGAGDAWNAANIYADANNFPPALRLTFANAFAAYYISSQKAEHPTIMQLKKFLAKET
jgi:sugar/nucleoside kinase (ribokinase family)